MIIIFIIILFISIKRVVRNYKWSYVGVWVHELEKLMKSHSCQITFFFFKKQTIISPSSAFPVITYGNTVAHASLCRFTAISSFTLKSAVQCFYLGPDHFAIELHNLPSTYLLIFLGND